MPRGAPVTRVTVDAKVLLSPRGGVARYLEGLLAGCREVAPPDVELELLSPPHPRRTLSWVLWDLQRASRKVDLLHLPFYYGPLAPRCPTTVAVHDVLFLEHPEWFPQPWVSPLRWVVPRSARHAAAVVASGEAAAATIEATCKVPRSRIRVIPYGIDTGVFYPPAAAAARERCRRLGLEAPFLLQLGALEPRRGVDLTLAAAGRLRAAFPGLELVLAGEVRADVAALEAPPTWVRRLGRVAEDDLPPLYAGAAAVVAPSRGEGFDLPVLEALACGGAVVASDIPPHVEHFAPAVELFASGDAGALESALRRVLADSARAASLRAGGPVHAAAFRWEETAAAHLELWREVAG